ncbi:MAG: hypothetical protein ACRDJ5_09470 [Actinomycetota bacterium]
MNDGDDLATRIFRRASNLGVTASSRFEGGSADESVAELLQMAGGDEAALERAAELCREALDNTPDNDEIRRGCELLAAARDEAGTGRSP